jgi:hypothetical protein
MWPRSIVGISTWLIRYWEDTANQRLNYIRWDGLDAHTHAAWKPNFLAQHSRTSTGQGSFPGLHTLLLIFSINYCLTLFWKQIVEMSHSIGTPLAKLASLSLSLSLFCDSYSFGKLQTNGDPFYEIFPSHDSLDQLLLLSLPSCLSFTQLFQMKKTGGKRLMSPWILANSPHTINKSCGPQATGKSLSWVPGPSWLQVSCRYLTNTAENSLKSCWLWNQMT